MNFDEIVGKASDLEPVEINVKAILPAERHRAYQRMMERSLGLDGKNTIEHVMTKLIIGLTHMFEEFEEKQRKEEEKLRKEAEDKARADAAKSNTAQMPGTKQGQRAA